MILRLRLLPGAPALSRRLVPLLAVALLSALAPPSAAQITPKKGEVSLGFFFGSGWYDNASLNAILTSQDPPLEPIETGLEYGAVLRYRLSRWVSLGFEGGRMDGRQNLRLDDANVEYSMAGTPVVADLYVSPLTTGRFGLNLFAGGGVLAKGRLQVEVDGFEALEASKTGTYYHAGVDADVRFANFAFLVRGLWRRAEVNGIDIGAETGNPGNIYDIDFNGFSVTFGPRWYFGTYEEPEDEE